MKEEGNGRKRVKEREEKKGDCPKKILWRRKFYFRPSGVDVTAVRSCMCVHFLAIILTRMAFFFAP